VLEKVNFPILMGYITKYEDENYNYFLTEFIRGAELFDVIREIGILTEDQARFYTASMILAIEYLHKNKIIYRDLKPENSMVTGEGFLRLVDYGTAKFLKKKDKNHIARTFTIIGSP